MLNEKQKMIVELLRTSGCATAKDISNLLILRKGVKVSPQSVAGTIRPWIERGWAANSPNGNGGKVYWLTEYGKTQLKEQKSYG